MKCPHCFSEDIRVVDTQKYDTCVIRIRVCDSCNSSWTTSETFHKIPVHTTKITIKIPK